MRLQFFVFALLGISNLQCSGDLGQIVTASSPENESGVGGAEVGSTTSNTTCSSNDECDTGEFCSVSKTCLEEGFCSADEDCVTSDYCSSISTCIPDGTCADDKDCDDGYECETGTSLCVPGGECGAEEFIIEAVPPNIFVVLDRSCSMIDGSQKVEESKWGIAVEALNLMTTDFVGQMRWGLTLFPDTQEPSCEQGSVAIAIGDGNETALQSLLTEALQQNSTNYPDGPCVTNIDTAILQASQQTELLDTTRGNYVLLITDGEQYGCDSAGGDTGTEQMLKDMYASNIATFVIGFGTGVDPQKLNTFAIAGGVPKDDPKESYYQADDSATLQEALTTIAGSIVSCSFTLDSEPPNPDEIYVFFDDTKISEDPTHTDGWDYDEETGQLTFYGSACESLQNGDVSDVDVVYGCDQSSPD